MDHNRALRHILIAATVVVATGVGSQFAGAGKVPAAPQAPSEWTFEGRVYEGDVGAEPPDAQPLEGVTVSVYGANDPYPEPGAFIASTTTNSEGWYGLEAPQGYEFHHIRETDSPGFASEGATTVDGLVRTTNWIE